MRYPFGMAMMGRSNQASSGLVGKFGFNGQQKDDEVRGAGNSYDFKYRGYDSRLGRFSSVDPVAKFFPWNSTYAFAENRVIDGIDFEGLEVVLVNNNDDNKIIYNVGINHHDDNKTDIYAHGDPGRIQDQTGAKPVNIRTPQAFKALLEKKAAGWRDKKTNGTVVIVLHSCRTGRDN